jgi:hypothetical protein
MIYYYTRQTPNNQCQELPVIQEEPAIDYIEVVVGESLKNTTYLK